MDLTIDVVTETKDDVLIDVDTSVPIGSSHIAAKKGKNRAPRDAKSQTALLIEYLKAGKNRNYWQV